MEVAQKRRRTGELETGYRFNVEIYSNIIVASLHKFTTDKEGDVAISEAAEECHRWGFECGQWGGCVCVNGGQ